MSNRQRDPPEQIQADATAALDGPDTGIETAIARFLASKEKAGGGGTYVEQAQYVLSRFAEWAADRGVTEVRQCSSETLGRYAGAIARRVDAREADADAGISASTAHAYWSIIAAWTSWCQSRELLGQNVARTETAMENLPDDPGTSTADQQFWSPETRERIVRWTDWKAEDALDHGWGDPERFVRDRAFIALLAYSGARIGELLRSRADNRRRRQGLRWADVDLDAGTMTVLGKTQQHQQAPIPDRAQRHLRAHHGRQDPPTPEWPLFPTRHLPSVYDALETGVSDDVSDAELAAMKSPDRIHDALREHDVTPPALSTAGGRRLLREYSEEARVYEEGEVLEPHGARRGLGDQIYTEVGHEAAQQLLRHEDPATTAGQYQHREAAAVKAVADEVLGDGE